MHVALCVSLSWYDPGRQGWHLNSKSSSVLFTKVPGGHSSTFCIVGAIDIDGEEEIDGADEGHSIPN